MTRFVLASIFIASTLSSAASTETVVIDDTVTPMAENQIYSQKCPNGRSYAIELSRPRGGIVKLIAHYDGKSEPVDNSAILSKIMDGDLYTVRMTCGGSDAYFTTKVAKPGGGMTTQDIVVSSRTGVKVYPAEASARSG